MSIRINLFALFALLALLAAATFGATYYLVDRTGLIKGACELGLPNPTLPAGFADGDFVDRFDCPVFGERKRYFGYIRDVDGRMFFHSNDLSASPEEGPFAEQRVLLLCEEDGCGSLLSGKLAQHAYETCIAPGVKMRFAGAIIEGTESWNAYLHGRNQGNFDRLLYVTKVEEAFDPQSAEVDSWVELGQCDDERG